MCLQQNSAPAYSIARILTGRTLEYDVGEFKQGGIMLYWALMFLVIAIIAAVLGFTGVAVAAAGIAKLLFLVFLVLFVLAFGTHMTRRGTRV
jgi:uncharacterized membrane protein YtjA (UPF0391 family)